MARPQVRPRAPAARGRERQILAALAAAPLLLVAAASGVEEGGLEVGQVPVIELGYPLLISDLPPLATRCFAVRLPDAERVRILASVVGLAGFPIIQGSWVPQVPGREPTRDAGFQTFVEEDVRRSSQYYICVRTFSRQGCDALLTASASDASDEAVPPIRLRPNYPSIWALGGAGPSPKSLRLLVEADDLEDVRISAVPVSGQLDVAVHVEALETAFASEHCSGTPLKTLLALNRPESLEVLHTDRQSGRAGGVARRALCIRLGASGMAPAIASLTVGPRVPGPFLVPAVPMGGQLEAPVAGATPNGTAASVSAGAGGPQLCEPLRLLVNAGSDVTITATSEDGSRLHLAASLSSELLRAPVANRWTGGAPPGGSGAVLVLHGQDVAQVATEAGFQGEVSLSVAVCRLPPRGGAAGSAAAAGRTHFWATAVTETGVVTLEDGLPFATTLPSLGSSVGRARGWRGSWRDFRFLVPGGAARPREITISATSSGRALLFADTLRSPRADPRGALRWGASAQNSSHPVVRLTTSPELASEEVHLVDCRLPCFVYVAAGALVGGNASADVDLEIQAQSDLAVTKQLLEDSEQEVTLAAGEAQSFRYRLARHGAEAALFSLSVSSGSATFQVSASADFPDDPELTTRPAEDVVLLEPTAGPFHAAVVSARTAAAEAPALFVRVLAGHEAPSTFAMVARAVSSVKALYNGEETRGGVEARGYDRYRFFLDGHAEDELVTIDVEPLTGHPALFVACGRNRYPRPRAHDWEGGAATRIVFSTADSKFQPGWVYVGIAGTGDVAAYTLRVRWGRDVGPEGGAAASLQDGMEELGSVTAGARQRYVFEVSEARPSGQPVALRAEALSGVLGLCVVAHGQPIASGNARALAAEDCAGFYAVANASSRVDGGLVALDLLALGRIELAVWGLGLGTSRFALRALASAGAATTVEEHKVIVDALGPACCSQSHALTPSATELAPSPALSRSYLHFLRPPLASSSSPPARHSAAAEIELRSLGPSGLAGARLRARLHGADPEPRAWAVEARAANGSHWLYLRAGLSDLLASQRHVRADEALEHGFWLEVGVEARRPLNYSVRLGDLRSSGPVSIGARLQPGRVVAERTSAGSPPKLYELGGFPDAPPDHGWRLRVRQCYGWVHVGFPEAGSGATASEPAGAAADADLRLPAAAAGPGDRRAVEQRNDTVLVRPVDLAGENKSSATALYELRLMPGRAGAETPPGLRLPESLELSPVRRLGALAFRFGAAAWAAARAPGSSAAQKIRYTIVAVLQNDSRVHADSSCGLREAIRLGAAFPGAAVETAAGQTPGRQLEAALPGAVASEALARNESLWVNLLVEALSADGARLDSSSFAVYSLSTAEAEAMLQAARPRLAGFFPGLLLLLALGACWVLLSRRGLCLKACTLVEEQGHHAGNGAGSAGAGEYDVELEVQYEGLDRDLPADGPRAPPRHGGYVPPTV